MADDFNTYKPNKRKEIINIRVEVNETKTKIMYRINETKSCFYGNINKYVNPLGN